MWGTCSNATPDQTKPLHDFTDKNPRILEALNCLLQYGANPDAEAMRLEPVHKGDATSSETAGTIKVSSLLRELCPNHRWSFDRTGELSV